MCTELASMTNKKILNLELVLFHLKHTISNSTVINHKFLRKKKLMCLQVLCYSTYSGFVYTYSKNVKYSFFFCFLVLGTYTMLFAFPRTIIFPAFIVCFQGTLRNDVSRLHLEELRKSLDTSCPFLGTRCNLVYQLFIFTHSQ